ncbi:MAG: 2-oxo acid dehydrogenase subunit E2 [Ignavibacteriales bacterium]|nr:2-oxo acid dehydrogenase subunit E2 [Ignavibacteriales bacterium]
MQVEVVMPKMGESIQEGKILRWAKKAGDKVQKDETILEISTDKVDSEIPSPAAGVLTKIVVPENETVEVGTVIAMIETDEKSAKVDTSVSARGKGVEETSATSMKPASSAAAAPTSVPKSGRGRNGQRFYSPLVRTIAEKEGVSERELDGISGSGIGGRVTKNDLFAYLKTRTSRPGVVRHVESGIRSLDMKEALKKYPLPDYEVRQMDNVQQKMAEHMVRSVQTSPHVQAISECDLTRIVNYRSANFSAFEKQEGYKLTFTPFFLDATVRALKQYPLVNSSVEGDKIIVKNFINLGMAVATPAGLLVPAIKHAEEKSFMGLARAANDIAQRARNKKLTPDDVQGGTFTVTNYGVFGNIIGIPIINQPQVAILGFGAIKKRPIVMTDDDGNDSIAIRSMCYLTLSFDHRILDGAIGGQFIETVVSNLENFDFTNLF